MPDILILADDLTGAADSGAQFARAGRRSLLVLQESATYETDAPEVLVLSSGSRALPDGVQAAGAVADALADLAGAIPLSNFQLVYKKIDSTLRGHPAAELEAVLVALGERRALIAPAFPAQGRTTLDGGVYIHNAPLAETPFASEVSSGDLRQVFGAAAYWIPLARVRSGGAALRATLEQEPGPWVADAIDDADLRQLAQAGLAAGVRVFCGSAGLAGALVTCLYTGKNPAQVSHPPRPQRRGPGLAVAGSLHPATRAQVEAALQAGAALIQPPVEYLTAPQPAGMEETAARLAAALAQGQDAILATLWPVALEKRRTTGKNYNGYAQLNGQLPPAEICARLATIAALAVRQVRPGGLFLTGGDTARAVCRALDCTRLWLGGEVEAGMPWSTLADGPLAGLVLVTKAGGFGGPDALRAAFRFLREG